MKKEDIHLKIFICLLLAFCSGFASCGDDEKEYDPCMPFEVALEKADAVYTEVYTLYGITNMGGELLAVNKEGRIQFLIRYWHQNGSETYYYPVNLPESFLLEFFLLDSSPIVGEVPCGIGFITFSGEVKPLQEGMEYNPVVLTYAEISRLCALDD